MQRRMANKVITVRQILDNLNGLGKNTPWVEIPGIGAVSSAKVLGDKVIDTTDRIAVKFFVHSRTGELKFFVAKVTNAPETLTLP